MTVEIVEARFEDENGSFSLAQLVERSGLSEAELRDLVEQGALVPVDADAPRWTFRADAMATARMAFRLRREFALDDPYSVCVVLGFAQRLYLLEQELAALRARLGE